MIVSPAHFFEISDIDNEQEKINAIMMLNKYGIRPEFSQVKYFISCNDKLLNSQSRMDSVKRHYNWQSKLNKEEFFAEVFKS